VYYAENTHSPKRSPAEIAQKKQTAAQNCGLRMTIPLCSTTTSTLLNQSCIAAIVICLCRKLRNFAEGVEIGRKLP
jgi:hypothetical protein